VSIILLESILSLRQYVAGIKSASKRVALVPTMGALHAGHMALVKEAIARGAHVIVSIFVNPLQFAAGEDLSKYPRTFEADRAKLIEAGAHSIYVPDTQEMYPAGFDLALVPGGIAKAGLEDAFRPTHFQGVATVVAKLFIQSGADCAMFGEKDYQQLKVVTHMVRDLNLPIEIIPVATTREIDGLAMSSRNVYLSAEDRAKAPLMYEVLNQTAQAIAAGGVVETEVEKGVLRLTEAGFIIDYFEARHAETLVKLALAGKENIRLLVAARLGKTRLIDNIAG
jgi:pantoate--beta-alanine ligase